MLLEEKLSQAGQKKKQNKKKTPKNIGMKSISPTHGTVGNMKKDIRKLYFKTRRFKQRDTTESL